MHLKVMFVMFAPLAPPDRNAKLIIAFQTGNSIISNCYWLTDIGNLWRFFTAWYSMLGGC